ncbi:peptidyl-tRNA hydrolase [Metschnikowia bicuspidata var. bicuspidata NRRL YB-4993]|uniref:peptidyl-tRNA hydrolase n=1 Tax=Metschnikowia bicuspidata var. bicuspidata NRRL YB-4993 TaxID=869754 RepID=A0A1A0HKK9_9ASCO|nr:peptidyl-tRNA hydrolase [Metschnikowia bicuspidata var. bicuspidata NRRL YB-4993]OBA24427.1 peptidyl-tRNA hydrolase [Metschnikowia bicuspidata var. bicuspidata NRRL YB-4993]
MTSNSTQLATVGLAGFFGGYLLCRWLKQTEPVKRRPLPRAQPQARDSRDSLTTGSSTESSTESGSESASESDSEDDIEIDSTPLNEIPGEVRMTLVVRQDLKMGKGKAAAQCSHATLALYKKMATPSSQAYNPEMLHRWEYGNGQAKITLQVPNMEEMDVLFAQAISLGVNAYTVHDAGRTQIAAGSATVLGLGPAPKAVLDQITGGLKLY